MDLDANTETKLTSLMTSLNLSDSTTTQTPSATDRLPAPQHLVDAVLIIAEDPNTTEEIHFYIDRHRYSRSSPTFDRKCAQLLEDKPNILSHQILENTWIVTPGVAIMLVLHMYDYQISWNEPELTWLRQCPPPLVVYSYLEARICASVLGIERGFREKTSKSITDLFTNNGSDLSVVDNVPFLHNEHFWSALLVFKRPEAQWAHMTVKLARRSAQFREAIENDTHADLREKIGDLAWRCARALVADFQARERLWNTSLELCWQLRERLMEETIALGPGRTDYEMQANQQWYNRVKLMIEHHSLEEFKDDVYPFLLY